MSIVLNDIIELTARASFLSQQLLNVFHYKVSFMEGDIDYEMLSDTFDNFWTINVRPYMHTGHTLNSLTLKNLTNGLDLYDHASNIVGSNATEPLASFMALAFRFNRGSALTRHGYKRLGGICENTALGNSVASTHVAAMNAIAAKMFEGLKVTGTALDFTCDPVIIGRSKNVDGSYEMDLAKVNTVSSVQFVGLTSQSSRKAGRGM